MTGRILAAAVVALMLAGAAGATGADTPGVSKDRILIGGTVPLSGPETAYSVVAYGADAYFRYVNDHGGVYGRKIEYRYLDDAYDPSQTVQQVRRLVEQDKVFAIFYQVGTEQVLASRPYLNQRQVPQLFAGSGAQTFAHDYKQYPWTLPYLPSFHSEGAVYGRYIARTAPQARIAVLYEDGTYKTKCVDCADEAIDWIRKFGRPNGAGIDCPLWWSSGQGGGREADNGFAIKGYRQGPFSRPTACRGQSWHRA